MWAGLRCVPAILLVVGNFRLGCTGLGREVTVKDYGVAVTMPQGQSRVPHPLIEQQ
jgi:hypothetical protein